MTELKNTSIELTPEQVWVVRRALDHYFDHLDNEWSKRELKSNSPLAKKFEARMNVAGDLSATLYWADRAEPKLAE